MMDATPTEFSPADGSYRDGSYGWRRRERAAGRLDLAHLTEGLSSLRIQAASADVVFVKGVLEASEGLAVMFAERGGELVMATPPDRFEDLKRIVADLVAEGCVTQISVQESVATPKSGEEEQPTLAELHDSLHDDTSAGFGTMG